MNKKYLFYVSENYSFAILRPLQEAILSRGDTVKWFLEASANTAYLTEQETLLTSVEQIKAYDPYAVFAPGNVLPDFIPGIKVGVFHGFDAGKINRRGDEDHYQIRGCFDLYCTFGEKVTRRFKALATQHQFFNVCDTGWPAVDPLFKPVSSTNPYVDTDDNRPTVLLCSTFSRNLTCAPHVYETVKRLAATGKWRWLVQFHPKMDAETVAKYKALESDNLHFIETDNVLPILQAADIMLCDTSSVLLMFLLQKKPVVTYNGNQLGNHLINISETSEIEAALEKALEYPADLMEHIDTYRQSIHPHIDGCSSDRVLDAVEQFSFSGLQPKPRNLVRQFKLRKKLGYWKLT